VSFPTGKVSHDLINLDGWRIREVGSMLLYTVKKHGIADTVFDKLLSIIALIANENRHLENQGKNFLKSVRGMKTYLGEDENACQKTCTFVHPKYHRGRNENMFWLWKSVVSLSDRPQMIRKNLFAIYAYQNGIKKWITKMAITLLLHLSAG
jgi:hypothetical protein